jgi:glutaryl-CoA dehydrogenase
MKLGKLTGVIAVERGMEGLSTPTTHGKWSLRASATGQLAFDKCRSAKRKYPSLM